jgi:hypothetical protein
MREARRQMAVCIGELSRDVNLHMGHKACPNLVSLLNKEHPTITESNLGIGSTRGVPVTEGIQPPPEAMVTSLHLQPARLM